jgi:hypothetical protein
LLLRQETQPRPIREIAWKAQLRLCARYRKLARTGKPANVVTAAIARELAGFVWVIARRLPPARRRADRKKPVIASQGDAGEPSDMLLPSKAGRAVAATRPAHPLSAGPDAGS